MTLQELLNSPEAMEAGRRALEGVLIDLRNRRLSMLACGNGFVVREKDGEASEIIRLSTLEGIKVFLKAVMKHQERQG